MLRALIFMCAMATAGAANSCTPDALDIRGPWGQARFQVEVVDTIETRALGLMHREFLATRAGMLFVYEEPQHTSFWMKNTLIPLDMIFIDENGTVVHIHQNAIPHDVTAIPSNGEILLVLEVNGGLSETFGITIGSEIRHPAVWQENSVWPCAEN